MGIISWVKQLFSGDEDDDVDLNDYIFSCPKCGSKNLGYFTGLANYVQAMQGLADPLYSQRVRCLDCGFSIVSEPGDESNQFLLDNLKYEKKEKIKD